MIALAAALALSAGSGLSNGDTLRPFFAKLTHAGTRPVHILQIGDSHTAGDAITGAWRDLLQQKYGSAGRGVLPPGRPYDGYITRGVTVTMSPGWKIASDFGATWSMPSPPLGLSAFTLTSFTDGATMALLADPNEAFDRFTVCAIMRPGAGSLTLHAGTESATFDLNSPTERPECRTMKLASPATTADLSVAGGPATLTSWATFRDAGGVVLSNLGVVGSQLIHWARTDDAVLTEELTNYRPDLIVVAFGTNEGFSPRVNDFEYEVTLRTQIGRIRRLAGNVPILVLGAPDALSRRAEMRANASSGEASPDCGTPAAAAPVDQPGVIETIMDKLRNSIGMAPSAPAPAPPPALSPAPVVTGTSRGPLFPPAGLRTVRDVQRRVAAQLNVAFWDWEARMGGRCTADIWVHATPPLMRGDYVHYTAAGGKEIAQRLQDDLDKAAAR
ncbi:MAG TPA: GDSL-type esterase/lipase family protein [Sphingomonas sp.]|uniref:GDSL-type esterase/lipase family protein n=1 Tax=Sphingomonas sp. TaxID=28214 RepID=UPI002D196D69|nr:GDSL-type esterase/lipase family protein [Sphingomonas sp.]HMI19986.1 GDSL-type esterase/lipase family protein [Sphingomonas sp.]